MFNLCQQLEPKEAERLTNCACEIKFDGSREAFIIKEGKVIKMNNRTGLDNLNKYPQFKEDFKSHSAILDSEVVVFKGLKTHLTWLQEKQNWNKAKAVVFDILFLDGKDLRGLAWRERREILENLMAELQLKNFLLSPLFSDFKSAWAWVQREQTEGLVLKNKDSKYIIGRTWYKIKKWHEQNIPFNKYENSLGGIVLLKDGLRVAMNGNDYEEVKTKIDKGETITATIQYLEKTKNGMLRFPSLKEWR